MRQRGKEIDRNFPSLFVPECPHIFYPGAKVLPLSRDRVKRGEMERKEERKQNVISWQVVQFPWTVEMFLLFQILFCSKITAISLHSFLNLSQLSSFQSFSLFFFLSLLNQSSTKEEKVTDRNNSALVSFVNLPKRKIQWLLPIRIDSPFSLSLSSVLLFTCFYSITLNLFSDIGNRVANSQLEGKSRKQITLRKGSS